VGWKIYIKWVLKAKGKERVLYPSLTDHLTTPEWLVTWQLTSAPLQYKERGVYAPRSRHFSVPGHTRPLFTAYTYWRTQLNKPSTSDDQSSIGKTTRAPSAICPGMLACILTDCCRLAYLLSSLWLGCSLCRLGNGQHPYSAHSFLKTEGGSCLTMVTAPTTIKGA
jgi:hypothetical protein